MAEQPDTEPACQRCSYAGFDLPELGRCPRCGAAWPDADSAAPDADDVRVAFDAALREGELNSMDAFGIWRHGYAAGVVGFTERVNARAEADVLAGNPITGAHHRAIEAELAALVRYREAQAREED